MARARAAQRAVAPAARGLPPAVPDLDLRGYSLQDYVAFALTNRPSLVSARLAVDDARLALKTHDADAPLVSATPWHAPHLSAAGGYSAASAPRTHHPR